MSFIQRELDRIGRALPENREDPRHRELYVAQQALAWALEPSNIKSPFDMLMSIPGVPEDCLDECHPPQS